MCWDYICVQSCSARFLSFNVLKIMWIHRGKCRFLGFHLRGSGSEGPGWHPGLCTSQSKSKGCLRDPFKVMWEIFLSDKRCCWKTLSIPWMTRGFGSMNLIARVACANIEMTGRTTTYMLWNEHYCSAGKLGMSRAWWLPTLHPPGSSVLLC